jgi:hypothetical protein
MRATYFKHRHWSDFSKTTNDIGRPLFWPKDRVELLHLTGEKRKADLT